MTKEKVIGAARGWAEAAALYERYHEADEAGAEAAFLAALEAFEEKWSYALMQSNQFVLQYRTAYYEAVAAKK